MLMNRIFNILTACCLAASLLGCADFLGEKHGTSYGGLDAVSTPSALEASVMGIHTQLASSGFKAGAFNEFLSPGSGLHVWGLTTALENPQEKWSCGLKFTRFSKNPESYGSFKNLYKAIYQCNLLLKFTKESPVDPEYVRHIEGEVYFLRAMAYFHLVRLYGDVSLHLEAPESTGEIYKPRENFWTVYCQIIKDLNAAASMMRDYNEMVAVVGGNASGRVCDYAAIACRSKVYLTIGSLLSHPDDNFWINRTPDFSEIGVQTADDAFRLALADAEDVIVNGPFELCPDYKQLFRWTNPEDWQLKERIWAIPRSPEGGGAGSALTLWALPSHYNGTSAVSSYGRCRPDRWFFQKWCEAYPGAKGSGSNNSSIYVSSSDPRLDINIIHNSYPGENMAKKTCYPTDSKIYHTSASSMKAYGLPYFKKYYDPTFDNSAGNADFYVMRFAEVYLIAAEATANLYFTGANSYGKTAMGYVNVILKRARDSKGSLASAQPADWSAADFTDKQELLNAIFWERCFEMPFEQHEWFDTHRMGAKWIVENISKPKNVFLYAPEQDDFELEVEVDGAVVTEIREGYRTRYYGKTFRYDEDWNLVRKGLISAYPYDELVYNTCLDETLHDPLLGQNPKEVYWR